MIKNWNNAKESKWINCKGWEDMTVPDEAWTIAELLQRHMNGIEAGQKQGSYIDPEEDEIENEYDLSKIAGLDPFEREMLSDELKNKIEDIQEKVKSSRKRAEKPKEGVNEGQNE